MKRLAMITAAALCCAATADEFDGYAKREMAEAVDLHAFENGDFDDPVRQERFNDHTAK